MTKAIYNKQEWVLCTCNTCGTLNYVEPHGTTAQCKACQSDTEHSNIPYEYRDMSGTRLIRMPQREYAFFWSPEGRKLTTIIASTLRNARAQFKRQFPQHAKYMGEVYIVKGLSVSPEVSR
jgi:hypothetical protein